MSGVTARRQRSGRPPKFAEPSGPVTITLPERTLDLLRRIDADRAKAIVKAVDAVVTQECDALPAVEVVEMAPGIGIVIVPTNRSLGSIPWIRTIEIAPTRHLLAIVPGAPIERIEVALLDLIEETRESAPEDVPMLVSLADTLRQLRRRQKLSVAEVMFVSIDGASR